MDYPSLKQDLILTLCYSCSDATSTEWLKSNQPIFITAAGIIKGEPVFPAIDEEPNRKLESNEFFETFINSIRKIYKERNKLPNEKRIPGDDGYIVLRNATMLNDSGQVFANFSNLVVFYDQIIAITVGSNA